MGCTHSAKPTDQNKGVPQNKGGELNKRAAQNKGSEMDKNNKNTMDSTEYQMYESTVEYCDIVPHYYVLDMGYGTGHGLRKVLKQIKGGTGRVIGTETSQSNIITVSKVLHHEISHGTLELTVCTPDNMPFITNMFECVYTVNGLHNWTDCDKTLQEIYRVLRPGCVFITCLQDYSTTNMGKKSSQSLNSTVVDYIDKLNKTGFKKVRTQEHRDAVSGFKYHIIEAITPQSKDHEI